MSTAFASEPPPFPRRLAPSAISRYLTCPKQFRLADLERVPRGDSASPVLCQANAIHHALERFYGLPAEDRVFENLERALRAIWCEHRKPGTFASKQEEREYGLAAIDMLERFARDYDTSVAPLAREQWVSSRFAGIELYGKVDRIDRGRDGGLELVDYKTGRHQLAPEDLSGDPAAQIYLLGAEETFGLEVERIRLIYLRSGDEVRWTPEREDVDALKERLLAQVERMRADRLLEATPGSHCRFCPFALQCPERQAVALHELIPVEDMAF